VVLHEIDERGLGAVAMAGCSNKGDCIFRTGKAGPARVLGAGVVSLEGG